MTARYYQTLEDTAGAIAAGEISSRQITIALLDRIAMLEPVLRAYAMMTPERALARADAADAALAAGRRLGPLHGVPIAVKDLCDTAGVRTAAGTRIFAERIPLADACVVERLEAAGAVLLGKLQMTEGAFVAHHPDIEPPVNPWNPDAWSGISSSGSGVATAAGLCFASLGSDTGGSIRYPSAANGIVGIKPTYGRVSRRGVVPLSHTLDHVGPMARCVRDAAIVLGVIAGFDPGDPTSLRAAVPDYRAGIEAGVRGLRIGLDERYAFDAVDPEIAAAVRAAGAELEQAGARIVAVELPSSAEAEACWAAIGSADILLAHEATFPRRAADYGPLLRQFLEGAPAVTGVDYARAQERRLALSGTMAGLLEEVDLLMMPSHGLALPPVPDVFALAGDTFSRFTIPFNVTGSPTISLPCGLSRDGRPISLQLVAAHLGEALLCRAGRAYERAAGWADRHPTAYP